MSESGRALGHKPAETRKDSRTAPLPHDPETGESFDPYVDDFGHELECVICGGDGDCDANADPLWDCDDNPHPCHACNGTGLRRDQRYW